MWDEDLVTLRYIQKEYVFGEADLCQDQLDQGEAFEPADTLQKLQAHIDGFLVVSAHLVLYQTSHWLLGVDPGLVNLRILKNVEAIILVGQFTQLHHDGIALSFVENLHHSLPIFEDLNLLALGWTIHESRALFLEEVILHFDGFSAVLVAILVQEGVLVANVQSYYFFKHMFYALILHVRYNILLKFMSEKRLDLP